MTIKIARLVKSLLIVSSVAATSLVGAYSYASDNNCNEKNAYDMVQTQGFPTSQNEGNYKLLFSKTNVAKANTVRDEILSLNLKKIINSSFKTKQINNLAMTSDMKFILSPSYQETYFQIKQASSGNKLFEMATQFNDKLQLILNKFKKIFITKNSIKTKTTVKTKSTA